MRFDLTALKYLNKDDFRVLTAIEMGMRNHEIVPVDLIQSISKIRNTSVRRILANLLKHKLIKHTKIQYDGYSLNFLGYDFLAIHSLIKQGILVQIGTKIGVGKESDVYLCYVKKVNSEISDEQYNQIKENILTENALKEQNRQKKLEEKENNENEEEKEKEEEEEEEEEEQEVSFFQNDLPKTIQTVVGELTIACIKFARLGRTSFRAVKSKRDYVKSQTHYNWLYLSRLSSQNEYKNMKGLYSHGFSVPRPYGYNRHAIIMEYVPSYPLNKVDEIKDKEVVYHRMMDFILKLGENGLVHGDFNEFNILLNINKPDEIVVIDFPQMISIHHADAQNYFKRDVQCVKNFFIKKFNITFDEDLKFEDIKQINFLDQELKAYGYIKDKKNKNKKGNNEENKEDNKEENLNEINDNENEGNDENDNENDNEEDNLDLGQQLDYEKEMIENMKKLDMDKEEDEKDNGKENKKNKKLTKEDIKNKVKKMINKQNKVHVKEGKMGNRFKGKKDLSNKMAIKNA
jgi:RIO-like serine/threonine protein kinase